MRSTPRLSLPVASVVLCAMVGALLAACTGAPEEEPEEPTSTTMDLLDPALSMTPAGVELLGSSGFADEAPRVLVTAAVDPVTGEVDGTIEASLPVGTDSDEIALRYFPGLPSFKAKATAGPAVVDGKEIEVEKDAGLLTVPLKADHDAVVTLELPFAYTVAETELPGLLDALGGGELEPAQIGLLGRYRDRLSLGHWFPLWMPAGTRHDPVPDGFGDISNFAAADFRLRLTVPEDWTVIDSGVPAEEETADGLTTVTSYGTGMRDLSVAVVKDYVSRTRTVDGVELSAWGPESASDSLDEVLDEAQAAVTTLSRAFTGYPWKQFDVISTPLGGGVAGMEWPGATWIEAGAFSGGFPGLGELGEAGELLGPLLGGEGVLGELIATTRPWTIAHEAAHIWWTLLVGNDSIASPVVDEPLAQYSACLVFRATRDNADETCESQIVSGYAAMDLSDDQDAQADQASDEFTSPAQYGGVVYGKAAWFYVVLDREFGATAVQRALRTFVQEHAFELVDGSDLRAGLVSALGKRAGTLWDRWMEQVHGDQDMPDFDLGELGGLGGLGELGDLGTSGQP